MLNSSDSTLLTVPWLAETDLAQNDSFCKIKTPLLSRILTAPSLQRLQVVPVQLPLSQNNPVYVSKSYQCDTKPTWKPLNKRPCPTLGRYLLWTWRRLWSGKKKLRFPWKPLIACPCTVLCMFALQSKDKRLVTVPEPQWCFCAQLGVSSSHISTKSPKARQEEAAAL